MEPITLFSKILFCTDFSRESVAAFSYALELCRASKDAEIILFHVIPEPDAQFWKTYIYELDQIDEKAKEAIDQQFAEDYLSRVPAGTRVSTRVAVGNAGQQVISLEKDRPDCHGHPWPHRPGPRAHGQRRREGRPHGALPSTDRQAPRARVRRP